jgi:hypothetical protein
MSIGIAMVSNVTALVATDSQRVEANQAITPDWDKTFSVGSWLIGANAGLLDFSGRTIGGHAGALFSPDRPLSGSECLGQLSIHFRDQLLRLPEQEVGFKYRRLDVLLVARSADITSRRTIHTFRIEPNPDNTDLIISAKEFPLFATIGDEAARAAIQPRLDSMQRKLPSFTTYELTREATKLITQAILASEAHAYWPRIKACGGIPKIRTLSHA